MESSKPILGTEKCGLCEVKWPCPFLLENELALITGGGSGLGLAMARCMAAAGAHVVLAGRREEMLKQAATTIGFQADYITHDVTRLSEAPSLVDRVTQQFGAITILVNNAGVHLKKPAVDTTEEEFMQVLTTHVLGAHALSRAVAPGMIQRRSGSVLFIASMASLFGIPQVVAYSAAKSAYLGMVRALSTELSPTACASMPLRRAGSRPTCPAEPCRAIRSANERFCSRTPMARFGEPDDVGLAAVYLCSPAAKFITGVVLPVDGGVSAGF